MYAIERMIRLLKSFRRLVGCRKKVKVPTTIPGDERRLPSNKNPCLPTDMILHIARFVGDRDLWNTLISLNKVLYHASKQYPAPWPNHRRFLCWQDYLTLERNQFVFSADSQWLLWTSMEKYKEKKDDTRLIGIWNARSGLKQMGTIGRVTLDGKAVFSKNGRFLAVSDVLRYRTAVRVYDFGATEPSFNPKRYVSLKPPGSDSFQIHQIALSPSGKWLVQVAHHGLAPRGITRTSNISVWNALTREYMGEVVSPVEWRNGVYLLCCTEEYIVWSTEDGSARLARPDNLSQQTTIVRNDFVCRGAPGMEFQGCPTRFSPHPTNPAIFAFYKYDCSLAPDNMSIERKLYVGVMEIPTSAPSSGDSARHLRAVVPYTGTYCHPREWSISCERFDPCLTWVVDGKYLAFQGVYGRTIHLFQFDPESCSFGTPSPASRPALLIAKANKLTNNEEEDQSLSKCRHLLIPNFEFSPDGANLAVLTVNDKFVDSNPYLGTSVVTA